MTNMNGWLHVIAGPMFSGKTDELVRQLRRQEVMGRTIGVFRPDTDNRTFTIKSRSGAEWKGKSVKSGSEVLNQGADFEVVAVDEAQFFDSTIVDAVRALSDRSLVIVSGLDKDFLGRPFGSMPELLCSADQITMLTAICSVCKGEASRTQRLVYGRPARTDDPLVVIGGFGDDKYEARCRKHHHV